MYIECRGVHSCAVGCGGCRGFGGSTHKGAWSCRGYRTETRGRRAARKLLCGEGGMAWAPGEGGGGGVPEMGFRPGPFVLCKDGCCHQRRRNTNFGPENFFPRKNFPPHMCSQNDQRDVGIILSMLGSDPPPLPGTAGRAAPAQTPLPARRPRRGRGGLGKWASVPPPPPRKANFFPPSGHRGTGAQGHRATGAQGPEGGRGTAP